MLASLLSFWLAGTASLERIGSTIVAFATEVVIPIICWRILPANLWRLRHSRRWRHRITQIEILRLAASAHRLRRRAGGLLRSLLLARWAACLAARRLPTRTGLPGARLDVTELRIIFKLRQRGHRSALLLAARR